MVFLREKCPAVRGLFEDRLGFVRENGPFLEQTSNKPATGTVQKAVCCGVQNSARKVLLPRIILKKTIKKPPVEQTAVV